MRTVDALYDSIVGQLQVAGRGTPYAADANEPDPRYKGYGVRAKAKAQIVRTHRVDIKALETDEKLALARRLLESEYGEQQGVALTILEQINGYFEPGNFHIVDKFVRCLHGWSKIDTVTARFLPALLIRYPKEVIDLARAWNTDRDLWLRRASVVLFTRNVAKSGQHDDVALSLCENLVWDEQDMVRKGVGWALKDLMHSDKARIIAYVKQLRAQGVSSVITLYAVRDLRGRERAEVLSG